MASVELPQFVPLTALYVGRFPSTHHSVLFLWVSGFGKTDGAPKRLVLVSVQDEAKPQPAKTLQSWAMRNNPFFAPLSPGRSHRPPLRGVCTFEIDLFDVVGLDYINPLLMDASRLVIEAGKVTRRWFPCLEHCSAHYGWTPLAQATKREDGFAPVSELVSDLYRPSCAAGGGRAALPRLVPNSSNCRLQSSPSKVHKQPHYWQERSEERRFATVNRVFLAADRVVHALMRQQQELGSHGADGTEDPVEEVVHNVTINFRFDDPFLPYVLREVVHDHDHPHLLRLYEAGLPAWAIFLPQYTGLYRRSMRIIFAGIILLISCISMLLGFYDLYKRIPAVRSLLIQVLGPVSSKLEELVVVRFSVLIAWILPYSVIFRRLWHGTVTFASGFRRYGCELVALVASAMSWICTILGPALSELWELVCTVCQPLSIGYLAGRTAIHALLEIASAVLSTFRGTVWTITRFVGTLQASGGEVRHTATSLLKGELTYIRQACMSIYNGTMFWGVKIAKHQASLRISIWRWQLRMRKSLWSWVWRHPVAVMLLCSALVARVHSGSLPRLVREHLLGRLASDEEPLLRALCGAGPPEAESFGRLWAATAPVFCRSTWLAVAGEFTVTEVTMVCGSAAPSVCWELAVGGGRRCGCPHEALIGLNLTTNHPGVVDIELAPRHFFSNGSLTPLRLQCASSGAGCFVGASELRSVLRGDVSAELQAVPAWRFPLQVPPAVSAVFVVEVPRSRALAPWSVELCLQAVGESSLSHVVPLCDQSGAPELEPKEPEFADGGPAPAEGERGMLRASWAPRGLRSCRLARWEVSLEVGGRHSPAIALCSSDRSSDAHCVGAVPAALTAALSGAMVRSSPQASAAAGGHGAVRAAVSIRCADAQDEPLQIVRSPWYEPMELEQSVWPLGRFAALSYGLLPCLATPGAWALAFRWAKGWAWNTLLSLVPRGYLLVRL
mmetsp:Transcript_5124/g.14632  ORF Transcript_5124/g.14632 Transcript_5124/m.14632 type:complete len:955 (-) Transcript_5124:287-3151(-)